MSDLVELKRAVNPDLVAELRRLLAVAERGELIGVVTLCHYAGSEYDCHCVGQGDLGPIMVAFESWKFRQIAARELQFCGGESEGG